MSIFISLHYTSLRLDDKYVALHIWPSDTRLCPKVLSKLMPDVVYESMFFTCFTLLPVNSFILTLPCPMALLKNIGKICINVYICLYHSMTWKTIFHIYSAEK